MTDRPTYVRPTLIRHRSGAMNKFGAGARQRVQPTIDGVDIEALVEAYGSPLFVYSERRLRRAVRSLREALALRYPRTALAWSYKTCSLDAVCRVFEEEGSLAEVVSAMELDKAVRQGVPLSRVVYNGPYKTEASLRLALAGGARVHLDHFDELATVERIAQDLGIRSRVALRLSVDVGGAARWDRFGFHLDSGQAWDAVRRLVHGDVLELSGLHCHIGTYVSDPGAYREAAKKLVAFMGRLHDELGIRIDTLDLGGGFASQAQLKAQHLSADSSTPTFAEYAEALTEPLAELAARPDPPLLILEVGRALVDDAGSLITTAVGCKRLADGRQGVVVDAGVNLLYTSAWYRHSVSPTAEIPGAPEPTTLFGPLCMNIDVVADHLLLPPVSPGRRFVLHPVGAYNLTQSMQFIHLRPAVAMIGPDGQHACIRRAEVLEDLVGPERLAPWQAG
ncbi:MAG: diaminopimelate decarboxylase [Myxococcota bacterium]|jgi:diaminopimelate decarboxylase